MSERKNTTVLAPTQDVKMRDLNLNQAHIFKYVLMMVNRYSTDKDVLHEIFDCFIAKNEDPRLSSNFNQYQEEHDNYRDLLSLMMLHRGDLFITCKILRILKILSRKQVNRSRPKDIDFLLECICVSFQQFCSDEQLEAIVSLDDLMDSGKQQLNSTAVDVAREGASGSFVEKKQCIVVAEADSKISSTFSNFEHLL